MTPRQPYEYAIIRATPRVDRGECINIGIVLYCQADGFLDARVEVVADRVLAIAPDADLDGVRAAADSFAEVATDAVAGDQRTGDGLGSVFRWLTAPRSTVVHASSVHSGMTSDPTLELERLLDRLVR